MSARYRWHTAALFLPALAAIGCSNQPGALTMQVTPAKAEFDDDEPIVLSVKLRTADWPVCLSKARHFRYEVFRVGEKHPVAGNAREVSVVCGTGILESLILFPYLYVFAWLDVADAAGRFQALKANNTIIHQFCLRGESRRLPELNSRGNVQYVHCPIGLSTGEYDVRIVLRNERAFCGDFLPLPIGWRLYSQPTEATARVVVKSASSGAAKTGLRTRDP